MQTVSLDVSGMSCGHCVAAVEKALKGVQGVDTASVEVGKATVTLDPEVASVDEIIDAVEDAGYQATLS
jgi:copper chaperone